MSTATISPEELRDAAQQLAKSAKGRNALRRLLAWLNEDGLSLDELNRLAVMTLLDGAFGSFPGSARDEMDAALHPPRVEASKSRPRMAPGCTRGHTAAECTCWWSTRAEAQ